MMLTHCRFQDSIRVCFPFFRLSKTPSRLIFTSSVIVRKEMQRTIPIIFSWSAPSCFIFCLISFTYVPILDFLGLFLLPLDTEPFFGDAEKKVVRRKGCKADRVQNMSLTKSLGHYMPLLLGPVEGLDALQGVFGPLLSRSIQKYTLRQLLR